MTIETKSAAVQLALQTKANIALQKLERFAQNAKTITAAQAAPIDTACTALLAALNAAGFGTAIASNQAVVTTGQKVTGVTGTGTTATITVANNAITGIALS